MTSSEGPQRLARRFERQAATAVQRSSPLYKMLLHRCAADLAAEGPSWQLLSSRAYEPAGDALPLRLLAAVHHQVLTGQAADLARHYPSAGGELPVADAWPSFRAVLQDQSSPACCWLCSTGRCRPTRCVAAQPFSSASPGWPPRRGGR